MFYIPGNKGKTLQTRCFKNTAIVLYTLCKCLNEPTQEVDNTELTKHLFVHTMLEQMNVHKSDLNTKNNQIIKVQGLRLHH